MIRGSTFSPDLDGPRLASLLERVRNLMLSGEWVTLGGIQAVTGGSEAGISARIRELRNGFKYQIDRRRVGESGLYEYRLNIPKGQLGLPGVAT